MWPRRGVAAEQGHRQGVEVFGLVGLLFPALLAVLLGLPGLRLWGLLL